MPVASSGLDMNFQKYWTNGSKHLEIDTFYMYNKTKLFWR